MSIQKDSEAINYWHMTLFLYYTENRLTNKVRLRYINSGQRINIPTYVAHFISVTVPSRL